MVLAVSSLYAYLALPKSDKQSWSLKGRGGQQCCSPENDCGNNDDIVTTSLSASSTHLHIDAR